MGGSGGLLGTILGALGPFWEPKSLILGPLGALGTLKKTRPEKELKKEAPGYRTTSILEVIFATFFDEFSVYFSLLFSPNVL